MFKCCYHLFDIEKSRTMLAKLIAINCGGLLRTLRASTHLLTTSVTLIVCHPDDRAATVSDARRAKADGVNL